MPPTRDELARRLGNNLEHSERSEDVLLPLRLYFDERNTWLKVHGMRRRWTDW
jgi:hypothetical protein